MRKRILCTVICLIATLFLFLNGYGLWQFLQNYIQRQEEKVREWQREHQTEPDVPVSVPGSVSPPPPSVTTTLPTRQKDFEWVTVSVKSSSFVPTATAASTRTVPSESTSTFRTTRVPSTTTTTATRTVPSETTSPRVTSRIKIVPLETTSAVFPLSSSSRTSEVTWAPSTTSKPRIVSSETTSTAFPSLGSAEFASTAWAPRTASTSETTSTVFPSSRSSKATWPSSTTSRPRIVPLETTSTAFPSSTARIVPSEITSTIRVPTTVYFSTSTSTWAPTTTSTIATSRIRITTSEATSTVTASTTTPPPPTAPSSSTSTTTTSTTTSTTTESPSTTERIRTWTFPTRRPPIYDPDRHRYGQDRLHHQHHHHHHHSSTTSTPTTTSTTTEAPTTTTRIHITTPRYSSPGSNSIYDRITIPATSSYRNPYIHKIEVTSSTYRTPETTSRHHHHHHHNRTHIEIHSHHRHHLPYPQWPYPVIPEVLYSTTEAPTTTTTTTTTTPEETTTSRRYHQHHHHHHNHHHSSTVKPPTTTTRQSELDKWGFVESVEEVASEEDTSSTTTTTTTTTTTVTPEVVTELVPPTTARPRHRQPEPTLPPTKRVERDVTMVTGFLDIGRGDWDIYRRPLETYHKFMETLLTLENNFVVFTDESSYDFVIRTRTKLNLMAKTKVYKITLEDLPLYSYINEARKIIADELKNDTFYRTVADLDMRTHPESISAEYNIVVNSKTHFLHNVTQENPFNSEHFVWLDAGYGHANENYFPYSYNWRPALPDGKISLIKVTPYFDSVTDYDLKKLYRKNVALLSGGFIAGDKHSIGQLHSIIHRKFIQLIYQNHVDDDQTLLTLAVNSYPHLFHVVLGDWFDAFRLFAADPEVQMG